jgi:hypothetical protein
VLRCSSGSAESSGKPSIGYLPEKCPYPTRNGTKRKTAGLLAGSRNLYDRTSPAVPLCTLRHPFVPNGRVPVSDCYFQRFSAALARLSLGLLFCFFLDIRWLRRQTVLLLSPSMANLEQ